MTDRDRIWHLTSKQLANEANAEELAELEALLRDNPELHYALQNLNDLWALPTPDEPDADAEEAFDRHMARMNAADADPFPSPPPRKRRFLFIGSVVILLLAIGAWIIYQPQKKAVPDSASADLAKESEVSTNNGSRTKVSLPDGTKVWLNAESKITWRTLFNDKMREVNLVGEAYFDVAHDADRPFIVHTSAIDIRVLGTAFTVKSYLSDSAIETTLLRGLIEVHDRQNPTRAVVILRPNEKLVFNKALPEVARSVRTDMKPAAVKLHKHGISVTVLPKNKPDSLRKETAWLYNKLVFEGDRFDELATKMERWYNVRMKFSNERVKQYRFKGVFENESVQQALDALKLTARFEYRISGNEIEIYHLNE